MLREGSFDSRSSHSSSVDKPQAVCEDKDGSLQCLCYQHIAVWQRDMDYKCRAGEKAQHIPPKKHPPYPGHILAGQSNQRWCPVSRAAMVGSCLLYEEWSHSKRHPLWHRHYVLGGRCSWTHKVAQSAIKQHLKTGEDKLMTAAADKRAYRKEGSSTSIRPEITHRCVICNKDCHSHIGLFSHKQRCYNPTRN